jgi:hypothetical protein
MFISPSSSSEEYDEDTSILFLVFARKLNIVEMKAKHVKLANVLYRCVAVSIETTSSRFDSLHDAHKDVRSHTIRSEVDVSKISLPSSSIRHGSTLVIIGSTAGRLLREAIENVFSSTEDAEANPLS